MSDITTACESIKARAYCANGDFEGWLVHCAQEKLRTGRVWSVTTDEWQALISANNALRDVKPTDPKPF